MSEGDPVIERLQKEAAYYKRKLDEVAGANLKLDYTISGLQHDLKQKRQGFAVLVELQRSIGIESTTAATFEQAIGAINATLEMDRSAVLTATRGATWRVAHAAGYDTASLARVADREVRAEGELVERDAALLGTGQAERTGTLEALREALELPFLVCVPVALPGERPALLVTGRLVERPPFRPRLDASDVATLRAIASFIHAAEQNRRTAMVELMNTVLAEKNDQLSQTLQQLKETQNQLVLQEKFAALGALVAGVAHEINTPVGIGVTAASHMVEQTQSFQQLFASGGMKKSSLERFIETVVESGRLLLTNLQRTADLVQSFKQVAVDQSSEAAREFEVRRYLDDVLRSLGPKLKQAQHRLVVDCPDDIKLNSYPGAFAQIVTNLVMNSLIHAYDEGAVGELRFVVARSDEGVTLAYSDDGKGIPPEVLPRVFEPFFTTRRNQGGTGLGLHIVYNVVTQRLRGRLSVESALGSGTTFTLFIPHG